MIIEVIVGGVVLIVVIAVVVGVVDAARAAAWRRIAIARRRNWETRRRFEQNRGEPWTDTWDDD